MKKFNIVLCRILALVIICGCCLAGVSILPPETALAATVVTTADGYAFFEAENTSIVTYSSKFSLNSSISGMSGGKSIYTSTTDYGDSMPPIATPGDLEFSFQGDTAGSYYIWARIRPTSETKSAWVSINNGSYTGASFAGVRDTLEWYKIGVVPGASAGQTHTVKLIPRNTWFYMDCFVITNERNMKPEGITGTLVPRQLVLSPTFSPPPYTPPEKEHPRLYFRKSDIPAILQNAQKPENIAAWNKHQSNLTMTHNGNLPAPAADKSNDNPTVLGYIESWAFEYATAGNAVQGQKAVTAIKNYARTVVYIDAFNDGYTRNAGHLIFTIAEVYDWCYDLLSNEDKTQLISDVEALCADGMEVGWPPLGQGSITGHGSEAQTLRDVMSAAIAFYDERPDIYRTVGGRFYEQFVAARNFYYPGEWPHQGSGYGSYRGQWDFNSTWMMTRMGAPNPYNAGQHGLAYWFLYMRRPDGQLFRDGDIGNKNRTIGQYWTDEVRVMMLASSYYGDKYLKGELLRQSTLKSFGVGHGNMSCVEFLVFNDPDLGTAPLTDLPKTKYFGSPMGNMIARTGWEVSNINSNDTVVMMKLNEMWFANHHHLDAGHFQIYYKGILANDSGRYELYGSAHDYNYNKKTIAHNTMLVYDPSERMQYGGGTSVDGLSTIVNDGGQQTVRNGGEVSTYQQLIDYGYQSGTVEGHGFGPDPITPEYSYIKGDLTKAYTDKIQNFDRGFVFLNLNNTKNPAALIVFDKVTSSDASFKKTWLLHGLYEPQIDGNRTVFRNNVYGYNGKLTVDTLLPKADNTVIEKVGGPDKYFWVQGKNYPGTATLTAGRSNESDNWRMELSPKTAAQADLFLNVLQVGTSNPDTAPLAASLIEAEDVVGVSISDRVVLFSRADKRTGQTLRFGITGSGTRKVFVEGLKAGRWAIYYGNDVLLTQEVSEDAGTLYFTGSVGSYKLVYDGAVSGALPFSITDLRVSGSGSALTASAEVYGSGAPADVITAAYDSKGVLINLYIQPYTGAGTYSGQIPSSAKTVKMFVWGRDSMTPLARADAQGI